jgi:hypothetical protein
MSMKKLIESMDRIEECGIDEGPMGMAPSMSPPAPEMDKGNPVTVNVSMNASGKEHVADLLDMMKNAGLGDAAPAADTMMSPRMDMERLSSIMGGPADDQDDDKMNLPAIADLDGGEDESYAAEMDDEEDELAADIEDPMDDEEAETEDMSDEGTYTIKVKGKNMDSQNELARLAGLPTNEVDDEMEAEAADGGFGNATTEPDEAYGDTQLMTKDLSGGINGEKKMHKPAADGDNPMAVEAIKAALYAALTEKKAKPDFLDVDKDGDKKEPMKKALKDKGSKPKKGKVPPQFQKATEGRGKVMAGRGRGKKTKVMAGRGRGK